MPAESPTTPQQRNELDSSLQVSAPKEHLYAAWRYRPLSGLRWQLTLVYSLILSFLVILFSLLTYFTIVPAAAYGDVFPRIELVALSLIVLGACLVFFLTNLMLGPLRRLSDAAQAIALGDLQQCQRLNPLLQSDDEVSKIAASLNGIVDRLNCTSLQQQAGEARARRLFSDASHQLRTPLTSLRGFTELLMRGVKDNPETMQRILKLMHSEAERMTRLVNDLLMLARLDDGDPLQTKVTDLVDLAVESVEQARVLATDERKVSLYFASDERLRVQANADRLKQVFHILFDNAMKYGRPAPDGDIRLRLDKQNGYALVQVIDNGKGIDPNDLPHIFDRFYRGERLPTYDTMITPPPGAGLGLSIAEAIVHAHHGTISVCSESETETVFTVKLPCIGK